MNDKIKQIVELLDTEPINAEPLENGGARFWNIDTEFELAPLPNGKIEFTGGGEFAAFDEFQLVEHLEQFLGIPQLSYDYVLLVDRIGEERD